MKNIVVLGIALTVLLACLGCGSGGEEENDEAARFGGTVIPGPESETTGFSNTENLSSDPRLEAEERSPVATGNRGDVEVVEGSGENDLDAQVFDVSPEEPADTVEELEEVEDSVEADVAQATPDSDSANEAEEDSEITLVDEVDAGTGLEEELVTDTSSGEALDLADLELNGTATPDGLAVTTFLAENSDGGSRTEADLIGKPTVLWFFPFAGTPG